jgi:hypothetical protein
MPVGGRRHRDSLTGNYASAQFDWNRGNAPSNRADDDISIGPSAPRTNASDGHTVSGDAPPDVAGRLATALSDRNPSGRALGAGGTEPLCTTPRSNCTMHEPDRVKRELTEVDRQIGDAEMEIARQTSLMDRLARDGLDTAEAHALLNQMKATVAALYAHRRILVRRLN